MSNQILEYACLMSWHADLHRRTDIHVMDTLYCLSRFFKTKTIATNQKTQSTEQNCQ